MHLWVHDRINRHCLFIHRIFSAGPMKFDIVRCEQRAPEAAWAMDDRRQT
jgi:hypothetical protein